MSLTDKINHAFPTLNELTILTQQGTQYRGRSFWLGITQMALNVPRMIVKAVFASAVAFSAWAALTFIYVIAAPIRAVISFLIFACLGRITDKTDPAARVQVTKDFELSQSNKFKKRG